MIHYFGKLLKSSKYNKFICSRLAPNNYFSPTMRKLHYLGKPEISRGYTNILNFQICTVLMWGLWPFRTKSTDQKQENNDRERIGFLNDADDLFQSRHLEDCLQLLMSCEIAVSINPNDATTLHMLGEWCFQVADMSWYQRIIAETFFSVAPQATFEDALEYYLQAESIQPRFYSLNLLRIGHCYLELNKEDQAKYYLQLAASYPPKTNDDHYVTKQAAELLKILK